MVKTVVGGAVVAFVVFYVMTSPDQAATIVHSAWDFVVKLAHGLGDFVTKLSS